MAVYPSWYYERKAARAKAREQYFLNRTPTDRTTVEKRDLSRAYYRSLFKKVGTSRLNFDVLYSEQAAALISVTDCGLRTQLPTDEVSVPIRGSGIKPTLISWYKGAATPTASRTDWGTRVIKYHDTVNGRSHYSMPFSRLSGDFTADTLMDAFNALFGGTRRDALLGADNGRASIRLERVPSSIDS